MEPETKFDDSVIAAIDAARDIGRQCAAEFELKCKLLVEKASANIGSVILKEVERRLTTDVLPTFPTKEKDAAEAGDLFVNPGDEPGAETPWLLKDEFPIIVMHHTKTRQFILTNFGRISLKRSDGHGKCIQWVGHSKVCPLTCEVIAIMKKALREAGDNAFERISSMLEVYRLTHPRISDVYAAWLLAQKAERDKEIAARLRQEIADESAKILAAQRIALDFEKKTLTDRIDHKRDLEKQAAALRTAAEAIREARGAPPDRAAFLAAEALGLLPPHPQ